MWGWDATRDAIRDCIYEKAEHDIRQVNWVWGNICKTRLELELMGLSVFRLVWLQCVLQEQAKMSQHSLTDIWLENKKKHIFPVRFYCYHSIIQHIQVSKLLVLVLRETMGGCMYVIRKLHIKNQSVLSRYNVAIRFAWKKYQQILNILLLGSGNMKNKLCKKRIAVFQIKKSSASVLYINSYN